jgi:hypothetical protein
MTSREFWGLVFPGMLLGIAIGMLIVIWWLGLVP